MTIETLQKGNELVSEISRVESQLSQIANMIDESKGEGKIRTRVKGMEFELPKAIFKGEVMKQKKNLETQLVNLQEELNGL